MIGSRGSASHRAYPGGRDRTAWINPAARQGRGLRAAGASPTMCAVARGPHEDRIMTRVRRLSLLGLLLALALGCLPGLHSTPPLAAGEGKKVFRAGAFAQDITPEKFPVSVNGGMSDRQAKSAADRLHARCLVL